MNWACPVCKSQIVAKATEVAHRCPAKGKKMVHWVKIPETPQEFAKGFKGELWQS